MRPPRLSVRDGLRTAVIGPLSRPLRSALSVAGIAVGIATLVAVMGITASNRAHVQSQMEALGANILEVRPGDGPDGLPAALPQEAAGMIGRIGPVEAVTQTRALAGIGVFKTDKVPTTMSNGLQAVAVDVEAATVLDLSVDAGRWFDDASTAVPTVVLGSAAADRLRAEPGQRVWIGQQWYGVIGILEDSPIVPDLDSSALLFEDWWVANAEPTEISVIYVRVRSGSQEAVRRVLSQTANPATPRAVLVASPSRLAQAQVAVDDSFRTLALGLAGVALFVGAIGIVNTMVIAVIERRGEIGLRRAVGARRRQIRTQFLLEAVLLGAAGGVVGTVLGIGVVVLYATVEEMPPHIGAPAIAAGFALALVVGAIAGAYPASRAARMPPTEALRGV